MFSDLTGRLVSRTATCLRGAAVFLVLAAAGLACGDQVSDKAVIQVHHELVGAPCRTASQCNDGNPCTVDQCVARKCAYSARPNGTSCNDNNTCTRADSCQAARCVGIPRTTIACSGTGGAGTGGSGTGGSATGGAGTGGAATGGAATGGAATGGAATGGAATGGAATGGAATGGAATGGAATGGAATGGAATGGAATGGAATGGAGTGGAGTGGAATGGTSGGAAVLYVVGHPDDDLLFVNPDLEREIQSGKKVRNVYVTSGDLSDVYTTREQLVMSAGAAMAGVADSWSCAPASYGGKTVRRCTLVARPLVSYVFIRVLDGRAGDLYDGATVGTADGATTYTKAQMLTTMSAIISEFQPTIVGTLDGTFGYGSEHPDHIAAALFALDTARADGVARVLKMHRGYTIYNDNPPPDPEPRNLTSAEHAEKARIMGVYEGGPLVPNDTYDQWCWRFYQLVSVSKGPGPFRHGNGKCLEAASATDGAAVRLATCSGSATQEWTFGADSRVRGPGGRCLGAASSGSGLVIKPCDGAAADQRWTLFNNGQVRGNGTACLAGTASTVSSETCATNESLSLYRPVAEHVWQP